LKEKGKVYLVGCPVSYQCFEIQ
jgi:hypothetical protein